MNPTQLHENPGTESCQEQRAAGSSPFLHNLGYAAAAGGASETSEAAVENRISEMKCPGARGLAAPQ